METEILDAHDYLAQAFLVKTKEISAAGRWSETKVIQGDLALLEKRLDSIDRTSSQGRKIGINRVLGIARIYARMLDKLATL